MARSADEWNPDEDITGRKAPGVKEKPIGPAQLAGSKASSTGASASTSGRLPKSRPQQIRGPGIGGDSSQKLIRNEPADRGDHRPIRVSGRTKIYQI